jgi:hypothetical protein
VVMDADLSHPPEKIATLLQPILANEADLVVGSRYIPGGATPGWPAWRRFLSRVASGVAYPLTGVHDSMGGFFAIRRECLLRFASQAAGFKIAFEAIVRGRGSLRVRDCRLFSGSSTWHIKMSLSGHPFCRCLVPWWTASDGRKNWRGRCRRKSYLLISGNSTGRLPVGSQVSRPHVKMAVPQICRECEI